MLDRVFKQKSRSTSLRDSILMNRGWLVQCGCDGDILNCKGRAVETEGDEDRGIGLRSDPALNTFVADIQPLSVVGSLADDQTCTAWDLRQYLSSDIRVATQIEIR